MKIFIVHAHHEAQSFNGAMTRKAVQTLKAAGHEVIVSDLYAMKFDPVSDRRNFTTVADPGRLSQQNEESHASKVGGFAPALQAEMDKLYWCDVLIFQFPIWWLGLPAILKGWVDRVFAVGRVYGGGRWFEGGKLAGRRAMLSLTVGGPVSAYSPDSVYGAIEAILHPIHRGVFQFVGLNVIEPFIVFGPSRISAEERKEELSRYERFLLSLDTAPLLPMPKGDDFLARIRPRMAEKTG